MKSVSDDVRVYLDRVQNIFEKSDLQNPFDVYPKKFDDEIGHLLDASKHDFNVNGEVDLLENDLLHEISNVRFAIANAVLFYKEGLTPFVFEANGGGFHPKEIDMRFFYFVDDTFIHFYTAWSRIANLLTLFFEVETKEKKADFADVVDRLSDRLGS